MSLGIIRSVARHVDRTFCVWKHSVLNNVQNGRSFSVSAACAARGVGQVHQHISDDLEQHRKITNDVLSAVNSQVVDKSHGRLFAIVHLFGNQYKVTAEDLIAIRADFPAEIGSRVVLEKVLLVGGRDFTLVGRPLLPKETIRIEATLLERTLSHRYLWFFMIRRKQYRKMRFYQYPMSVLRINSIQINRALE